jgi:hypothetical protein
MKHLITIIVSMIFFITFNTKAFASDSVNLQTKNNIDTSIISEIKLDTTYLISNQNLVTEAFSPEQNLDFTIGILLSIIPSFGVGNFWSGDKEGGWFFFKLDLIMLAIPFIISIISNIFYSLNISKNNNSDSMSNSPDIFTLLGLVAWSSSFGVKIWETASVYKYISTEKKIEKISISKDQISIKLLDF